MGKELVKGETENALREPPKDFVDFEGKSDIPAATLANARIALHRLGLNCWHDLFSNKKYIGGSALNSEVGGQVTDDVLAAVRLMIRDRFKFDPGKNNTWDAVNLYCREHGVHPVRKYLEYCHGEWLTFDGRSRIDTMLCDYFGAPDTPFVRGVSRIVMVASCRRIFVPGAKFDYMTVLESPEGYGKSQALATLCGPQWFSDQTILGLDDKHLAETVRGRWWMECADLSGMRKAEVEKVKAQLSRFEDRTRPAYGRAVIDTPRSCVFWGTTNDDEYLQSQTGNRRFLPVPVQRIDVDGLKRDRDMLWGEAMAAHLAGESILLPEPLWQAAAIEQEARTHFDPWRDRLPNVVQLADHFVKNGGTMDPDNAAALGTVVERADGKVRITTAYIMTKVLGIPADRQTPEHGKRLGKAMRKDGWHGPKLYRIGGRPIRGYERDLEPWD